MAKSLNKADKIIEKYKNTPGALIPILQETQATYGYLPQNVLDHIAKRIGLSTSQIYGVVTFYAQFYLEPHGKYTVRICRGTACHVRGGSDIRKHVEKTLGLKEGQTSKDLKFTLETVACLGACALAPVVVVNKTYLGKMSSKKVESILRQYL